METIALHGTSSDAARAILRDGFLPGRGVHSFLGTGVYAAQVCDDVRRNVQAAFDSAHFFAKRYRDQGKQTAFLRLRVSVDRGLHLQNPQIRQAFVGARNAIKDRLDRVGVVFEPRGDSFRPFDHVAIEIFRLSIEMLADWELDVLSAEFRPICRTEDSFPSIVAPELCIKRPRAILDIAEAIDCADVPASHDRPEDWPIRSDVREAAADVERFIREMTHGDFFDLFWKTVEGSRGQWGENAPRFGQGNSIALITGTPRSELWQDFRKVLETTKVGDRRIEFCDLNGIRSQPCPFNVEGIDKLVRESAGLILFAPTWEPDLCDVVFRAVELGRPVLSLTKKKIPFPGRLRFAPNTARIDLDEAALDFGRVAQMLKGFTKDRWRDSWEKHAIRSTLAARGSGTFADDAEKIKAAYAKKHPSEQLPGFSSISQNDLLSELPDSVQDAACELRRRLGVNSALVKTAAMERVIDEVYQLDIGAPGYFLRPGLLGPHRVVVLKKGDRSTRRRFTFAHEIAHAARQGMKQLGHIEEEKWCDEFAIEFLMPESWVNYLGSSLDGWLRFADVFEVSNDAASHRAWQCASKLILQSGQRYPNGAVPENLASELLEIATSKDRQETTNESGRLLTGEPFIVRRWPSGHFIAVADCSKRVEDANALVVNI